MKVFISWSGERSRDVAQALRDWIPLVLQTADPFMSSGDIGAGTRWGDEIAGQLNDTNFGLICVTRENLTAPWLNFEAGALAKAVESSFVVPIAIDLPPTDIPTPLSQFQAVRLTRPGIDEAVKSMNRASNAGLPDAMLSKTVDHWWPELQAPLDALAQKVYGAEADAPESPPRSERELLEEVVATVRGLASARTVSNPGWPPASIAPGTVYETPFTSPLITSYGGNLGAVRWVETGNIKAPSHPEDEFAQARSTIADYVRSRHPGATVAITATRKNVHVTLSNVAGEEIEDDLATSLGLIAKDYGIESLTLDTL